MVEVVVLGDFILFDEFVVDIGVRFNFFYLEWGVLFVEGIVMGEVFLYVVFIGSYLLIVEDIEMEVRWLD